MRSLEEINKEINRRDYETFPFINLNNRITKLKKGLYRKYKSNYRGITCVNVQVEGETEFKTEVRLNGYYNIPYDMVIVPENVIMTSAKKRFLNAALKNGFKEVKNLPRLKPLVYDEGSEEYLAALEARRKYVENMQVEKYYKEKMKNTYKEYER